MYKDARAREGGAWVAQSRAWGTALPGRNLTAFGCKQERIFAEYGPHPRERPRLAHTPRFSGLHCLTRSAGPPRSAQRATGG